jgi:hypothetical protein
MRCNLNKLLQKKQRNKKNTCAFFCNANPATDSLIKKQFHTETFFCSFYETL